MKLNHFNLLIVLFTASYFLIMYSWILTTNQISQEYTSKIEPPVHRTVKEWVLWQSDIAGLSVRDVERVINCESKFNPLAKNRSSTAKGLAQFLDSTWSKNCIGDVYNYKDNARCFIKHFENHKSWWKQCL